MKKLDSKKIAGFLIIIVFIISGNLYSQSSSFGNTYIFSNGEMGIVNIQHNFFNGGSGILPGTVGTERTVSQGFMSFVGTASWAGASYAAHVDGYVKTYMTTAFTFPIGDNGKYRPAAVSTATLAKPANAAYYGVSATTAITSKLTGGNEPVLPVSGPYNTALKSSDVLTVDNVEYWDINGATPAKITLTWDANSAISSLDHLCILGWNGTQWVALSSAIDTTSLLGGASSLTSGSITTNNALVPDTYEVYTLGTVCGSSSGPIVSNTISLINVCTATTANLNNSVTSTTPSGYSLVWFTNTTHTGTSYATPSAAGAGTYYPFYYDSANNCYTPPGSGVTVLLTTPPDQPTVASIIQPNCSGVTTGTIVFTAQSGVEYSIDNGFSYQSSPTFSGLAGGEYFLRVRLIDHGVCAADAVNAITIYDTQPGAPTLSSTTLINVCPAKTVNMNPLITSSTRPGISLVWFTNSSHTGSTYASPSTAVSGSYYAFYYDSINNCYSQPSVMLTVDLDSDCDGISDSVDIDDDDDGILDVTEQSCTSPTVSKVGATASMTLTAVTGSISNLLNGTESNDFYYSGGQDIASQTVAQFIFPASHILNKLEITTNGSTFLNSGATVKVQGWNGSTWIDITGILTPAATSTSSFSSSNAVKFDISTNTNSYTQYRVLGISGTVSGGPWVYEAYFSEFVCVDIDTDTDGIVNRFDLDSDGDGCPDAKESGVSGTLLSGTIYNTSGSSSVSNAIISGSVGSNGLANSIETNDTISATTSYTSSYVRYATSNTLNACADTDGDGVGDLVDIDDDNDGILDAIEAPSCYYTQAEVSTISNVTSQLAASSYPTRTYWYDNNATTFADFTPSVSIVNQEIYNITPTISPLAVSAVSFDMTSYAILTASSTAKLQGYDGTSWVDLSTAQTAVVTSGTQTFTNTLQPSTAYQKFRIYGVTGTCNYGYCTEIHLIPSAVSYGSAAPKSTCVVDTDGDGITNDKDLDSDGDGCPDAKEAGVTGTLSSGTIYNTSGSSVVSNALISGSVGSNGLANSIETNDTAAATTNYTSTYQYATNTSINACVDSDNDGILDIVDIDDDNDGILDIAEQSCTSPTVSKVGATASMTITAGSGTISNLLNGTETSDFYYSGGSIVGQTVAQFNFPASHILNKLEITTSGGNFFTTATVKVQGSNNGTSWTDVSGILTPASATTSTFSTNFSQKFDISTNTNSFNQYRVLGVSGTVNSGPWVYEAYFSELVCTDIDTDGDGKPNRLDLDSDGDGCCDAKESGATTSNATNYVFTSAVGANGLANSLETASESGIVNYTLTYSNATNNTIHTCTISCPTVTNSDINNSNPTTCTGTNGTIKLCGLAAGEPGYTINYTKNGIAATALTNQTPDTNGCLLISNLGAGIYNNIIITHPIYCTTGTTALGPITITAPSGPTVPTVASTTQPTCAVPSGTIIFTAQSGVEYSVNNGTTYQASATFAGLETGSYTLKVRSTTDSTCLTAATNTVTMVSAIPTTAGIVSPSQAICTGTSPSDLILSGNIGNVIKWQKSIDAAFTNPIDISSTSSTLLGSVIGNLTTTTYFRAVVQNGTCSVENSNYITITISSTTWNGTSWSNGVPIITTTAYMTGNYSEATDLFACTLTVSNNAIVSIPSGFDVILNGKLTVEAGSSFTLNNNANLLQQTEVSNTGTIYVKRNTAPCFRLDYNLWSSPVDGAQNLMDFSPLTSNISPTNIRFYIYNTASNLYNSVTPTSTPFDRAKGYLIRMPNTWIPYSSTAIPATWTGTFTGTPRNGTINYTMTNLGENTNYNAVGNPYPSALKISNFINDNGSAIEGTLWFWRKINENNNPVSYSTCSTIGCTLNNNAVYTNDTLISVGQGFMVKAKTGQTNLNFTNSMRSSANVNQFFKKADTEMDRYWLKLSNSSNISTGQNLIAYVPNATTSYDSGLDGLYLNDGAVAFYSMADTKEVVINARANFDSNDIIPLVFKTNLADTYTFSLNKKEGLFNGNQDVYLRDNYNNTIQNLTLRDYSFSTGIGTFTNRFDIIYQNQLSTANPTLTTNQIILYNKDQTTFINSGEIVMDSIKIFDMQGRFLFQKSQINDTKTSIRLDVANQVLLFQITTQNGEIINKKNIK